MFVSPVFESLIWLRLHTVQLFTGMTLQVIFQFYRRCQLWYYFGHWRYGWLLVRENELVACSYRQYSRHYCEFLCEQDILRDTHNLWCSRKSLIWTKAFMGASHFFKFLHPRLLSLYVSFTPGPQAGGRRSEERGSINLRSTPAIAVAE